MNNTFIWLSFALLLPCSPNYTSSFSNIKSYRNKKGQNISKQITSNIERVEYQLAAANSPAGSSSKQPIRQLAAANSPEANSPAARHVLLLHDYIPIVP